MASEEVRKRAYNIASVAITAFMDARSSEFSVEECTAVFTIRNALSVAGNTPPIFDTQVEEKKP